MKNYMNWLIAGAIIAVIAFVTLWPPSSYFSKKSGTLRLIARFRWKTYRLKDYIGKTEFKNVGPVSFDVDFQKVGEIKFSITLIKTNEVIKQGLIKYPYAGNLGVTLPDVPVPSNATDLSRTCHGCFSIN